MRNLTTSQCAPNQVGTKRTSVLYMTRCFHLELDTTCDFAASSNSDADLVPFRCARSVATGLLTPALGRWCAGVRSRGEDAKRARSCLLSERVFGPLHMFDLGRSHICFSARFRGPDGSASTRLFASRQTATPTVTVALLRELRLCHLDQTSSECLEPRTKRTGNRPGGVSVDHDVPHMCFNVRLRVVCTGLLERVALRHTWSKIHTRTSRTTAIC